MVIIRKCSCYGFINFCVFIALVQTALLRVAPLVNSQIAVLPFMPSSVCKFCKHFPLIYRVVGIV